MIVVGGLLVDEDGRVLMGLRPPDKLRPDLWEYPGGKVDSGETLHEALRREWQEELGVTVNVSTLIATVELHVEEPMNWSLYRVQVPGEAVLEVRAHTKLCCVDPTDAIRRMPCTPTTYLSYRKVVEYLRTLGYTPS